MGKEIIGDDLAEGTHVLDGTMQVATLTQE